MKDTSKSKLITMYERYKELDKDLLVTFQDTKYLRPCNHKEFKSYKWLKDKIGFYPVWCIYLKRGLSFDQFKRNIDATMCSTRPYAFFFTTSIHDINTDYYNWCEIHEIENKEEFELTEEDLNIREIYTKDWEDFLLANDKTEITQTLVKDIKHNELLFTFYQDTIVNFKPNKSNSSTQKMSLGGN